MSIEEQSKGLKQSSQSRDLNPHGKQQEEIPKQFSPIPEHLQDVHNIARICQQSKNKLIKSGKFKWDNHFKVNMDVQILETNFEWMRVMLHYGNFKFEISVIYTEIDDRMLQQDNSKRGAFGVVRFLEYESENYAIKGIKFSYKEGELDNDNAFREYFLCCIADILEIGPKILPLFGYDILLTKTMAFFCMEECKPIKVQSLDFLENELMNNLKIMNSLQIVHNDIKPENVAYSAFLHKHVFIDFGLSKIIKQPPGEKTRTKFAGTLSYCSDQMKKCYLLGRQKFVNLNSNDLCCLKNTIKAAKALKKNKDLFQRIEMIIEEQQVKNENPLNIFHQVIQVLRLKHCIQTQNVNRVLNMLTKAKAKKIIYQLLFNQEVPEIISNNQRIRSRSKQIKNKIFSKNFQIDIVDSLLCDFFCQEKRLMSVEKIIPITQILYSESDYFQRYLIKPELVLKLFHFLDPFSNGLKQIENKRQLKRAIIEKIYKMKNIEFEGPIFFCEKVRFVLIHFYENLRKLENLRVMLSLRLLFILIEEWGYMRLLENEIIASIQSPFLGMLKIIEFALHRFCFERYGENISEELVAKYLSTNNSFFCDNNEQKARNLLKAVMEPQFVTLSQQNDELKLSILNQINLISQQCLTFQEKQSIYNIKYLYINLCKIQEFVFCQGLPKGLALKIYLRTWNSVTVQLTASELEDYQLFWSIYHEYPNSVQGSSSQNLSQILARNQFILLQNRNQPLRYFLPQVRLYPSEKYHIFYFFQRIKQLFSEVVPISHQSILQRVTCVNEYAELIIKNLEHGAGDEKIGEPEKVHIFTEVEKMFKQFLEQEEAKEIVEGCVQIKVKVMIAMLKLGIEKGDHVTKLRVQMFDLIKLLQPLPNQPPTLIIMFFTLYDHLCPILHQPKDHDLKYLLICIASDYMILSHSRAIEQVPQIPRDFRPKTHDRKNDIENFDIFLGQIQYYSSKKNFMFIANTTIQIFQQNIQLHCPTQNLERLRLNYLDFRDVRKERTRGLYGYLVFMIFIRPRNLIDKSQQLKQITTTTISLQNMPSFCYTKTKPQLFPLYKHLVSFKSKRKAFICRRLQIRNTLSRNKFKIFGQQLCAKMQKICGGEGGRSRGRGGEEDVFGRFVEKVKEFQRL